MSSAALPAGSGLPAIDDRLVEPEGRFEMVDGELVEVSPADRLHASRHVQLAALMAAHTGLEFEVGADLLTRTSLIDDIAPDVSVYPAGPDPTTRGRQLEQLAFEIVSTQSLRNAGVKAAKLVGRGVRRVFAIDVEQSRALEWSAALGAWRALDPAGLIEDPALDVPLPIDTIIHIARADDAVMRALIAKDNPVLQAHVARHRDEAKAVGLAEGLAEGKAAGIAEGKAAGIAEGLTRGKAEALLAVLAARGLLVGAAERGRILGERDPGQLDRWLAEATTCAEASALFTTPSRR
jgi:hypothetical protein